MNGLQPALDTSLPWDCLPPFVIAHVLYCLCYTYHERDKVYEIWCTSKWLHDRYTPWFREAFQQRHVYNMWCTFLHGMAMRTTSSRCITFHPVDAVEGVGFSVFIESTVPMRHVTQASALPVTYVTRNKDSVHQHRSIKSVTFAMDGDLFFLRFERYNIRDSCQCFPERQASATQVCGVIKRVVVDTKAKIGGDTFMTCYVKWAR